jgi:hypothetical protein
LARNSHLPPANLQFFKDFWSFVSQSGSASLRTAWQATIKSCQAFDRELGRGESSQKTPQKLKVVLIAPMTISL